MSPSATVLLDTRDVPAVIMSLGRHGVRLRVNGSLDVFGEIRLAFGPGRLVLTQVVTCSFDGDETLLTLRYVAAWARDGREALAGLLSRTLRLPAVNIQRMMERSSGWFYVFSGPGEPPPRPEPVETLRKEKRVAVRVPVDYVVDGESYLDRGTAYNVSEAGLGILTPAVLPVRGREVTVFYPLTANTPEGYAVLRGMVRWGIDGMSGPGGGFGIQLIDVRDGEAGALWRGYVQSEAQLGMVLDVEREGPINPDAGSVPGHPGLHRRVSAY